MLFGFIFFLVPAAMLVGVTYSYYYKPETVHSPIMLAWVLLLFFMAAGGTIFWFSLIGVLAAKNEKIVFTPDHFEVVNKFRRVSIRCNYDQILRAEESILSPKSSKNPQVNCKCTVKTEKGTFVIRDSISRYRQLRDFFTQKQADHSPNQVFHYRADNPVIFGIVLCAPFLAISFYSAKSYLSHEQTSVNGELQTTPLVVPLIWSAIAGYFVVVLVHDVCQSLFERIVVSDGKVVWFGRLGRIRLDVPLTMIVRGSFELVKPSGKKDESIYRVITANGKLEWDDSISHCSDLVKIMKKASDHSPLRSVREDDTI